MLCTLKVRAWCRTVFTSGLRGLSGLCGWRSGCGVGIQVALSFLASAVLAWLACAFAAVTAVAVTRAALTAFAVVFRRGTTFLRRVRILPFGGDHC